MGRGLLNAKPWKNILAYLLLYYTFFLKKKNHLKCFYFPVLKKIFTLRGTFWWIISWYKHTFAPLYLRAYFLGIVYLLEKPWCVKLIGRMPSSYRQTLHPSHSWGFWFVFKYHSDLCVYVRNASVNTGLKGCIVLLYLRVDVCLNLCIGAHILVVYFKL